ncbi:MAG: adenine phosphoribosyltransferase [Cytophaga sp.]|uniref:adenine phosphoribosyltransferase n=1 Tax=Cytophaga sp. TaxID=29535 RepID=UPI003F81B985
MAISEEILEQTMKSTIRDIVDFPQPGIVFKDITPLLKDPGLCKAIVQTIAAQLRPLKPDALACLDSRGFWFGLPIAMELGIPMIPIRKKGKLPYETVFEEYELEYGTNTIEMHTDAIAPGSNVVIHDDILATGGTAEATSKLIKKAQGNIVAYSFLIELNFLDGKNKLQPYCSTVQSLISY